MVVTKAEFARLMGWNKSTATRYADKGKLVVTAEGKVDVEASKRLLAELADPMKEGVRRRHEREREARRRRDGDPDDSPPPQPRADPNDSSYLLLQKHRAESEAHRAAMLRMEREQLEGRLGDTDAMRRRAFETARAARNAIQNLPHRIDPLLAGEADAAKRAAIWERELRAILTDLARSCGVEDERTG